VKGSVGKPEPLLGKKQYTCGEVSEGEKQGKKKSTVGSKRSQQKKGPGTGRRRGSPRTDAPSSIKNSELRLKGGRGTGRLKGPDVRQKRTKGKLPGEKEKGDLR